MSTKKTVPVKTIVSILSDGSITIQKQTLDETVTEQLLAKSEA